MGRLEPGSRDRDACIPYESVALGQRVEGREELRRFYEALLSGPPDNFGAFDGTAAVPAIRPCNNRFACRS